MESSSLLLIAFFQTLSFTQSSLATSVAFTNLPSKHHFIICLDLIFNTILAVSDKLLNAKTIIMKYRLCWVVSRIQNNCLSKSYYIINSHLAVEIEKRKGKSYLSKIGLSGQKIFLNTMKKVKLFPAQNINIVQMKTQCWENN